MRKFDKVIVHPGIFHLDDVLSVAIAKKMDIVSPYMVADRKVPTPEELEDESVLVLDIGGVNDGVSNFDHHQDKELPGACLLVWDKFAPTDLVKVREEFVEPAALSDVGKFEAGKLSLPVLVHALNPNPEAGDSRRNNDFDRAVYLVEDLLSAAIQQERAKQAARSKVLSAEARDGVLMLSEFVPWGEHIFDRDDQADLLYVVYPSLRGGYCVQQVAVEPNSFEGRKPLPEEWGGKRGEELQKLLGLLHYGDSTFCHPGRFVGGAQTLGDTLRMARLAVEA